LSPDPSQMTLRRRFLRLAVPNSLSNLMVPLAGLVDIAFLGHLDSLEHLGGVALGTVLFDYVYWTFGFLRMGTTGLVAQEVGRGDPHQGLLVGIRGMAIGASAGIALWWLHDPLREAGFAILSGTPSVIGAGKDYFDARIVAAPAALVNLAILGWLLGSERSRAALLLAVVVHGCNIVLDLWFIVGLGWGAAGAGYATAASQVVMLLLGLVLLRRSGCIPPWATIREGLRDRRELRGFLGLGGDIIVRTLALVSTFAAFTNLASAMGTVTLAAVTVLKNVVTLAAFLIDGFAFATESLAGIYHGARQPDRLRAVFWMATRWSVGTALVFAAAFWLFPGPLLGLLTDHPDALKMMRTQVAWLFPVLGFGAVAYVLDGYFIGLAAGRTLSVAMVLAAGIGFVPLAWWAAQGEDPQRLWLALSVFMVARVVSLGVVVPRTWKSL